MLWASGESPTGWTTGARNGITNGRPGGGCCRSTWTSWPSRCSRCGGRAGGLDRRTRVRLAALTDAPSAFWSSYAQEVDQSEQQWRDRIERGLKLLAVDGDRVVGHAGGFVPADRPGEVELVAMWVEPAARGRGVGAELVEAVADWARSIGAGRLHLWVEQTNAAAYRLYRGQGFAATGERQPMPPGGRWELAMARPL